jgi:uncharacterized protein
MSGDDSNDRPGRTDVYLVAGGKYHDIDFARLELLTLLAEHETLRVTVAADYEDTERITACDFLVSYTCDVRPSEPAQQAIRTWVQSGARWIALHGTNAALDLPRPNGVESPRCFPIWAETLGSQFIAHPPIQPYRVELADEAHWLVADVEPFDTDDELYLMEYHDAESLHPLLHTHWQGKAHGYEEIDWTDGPDEHLIQYLRPLGEGAVLYNTLGHCRGHFDMAPLVDYYPQIERCSWEKPQYYELLRRAIRWAMGANS